MVRKPQNCPSGGTEENQEFQFYWPLIVKQNRRKPLIFSGCQKFHHAISNQNV
jgi:hypothetical protein